MGEVTRRRLLVLLHLEVRASRRFNGGGRPVQLDMCRALPAEKVQEQFAGRPGDASGGAPSPCSE